jgi:hypothetical protein
LKKFALLKPIVYPKPGGRHAASVRLSCAPARRTVLTELGEGDDFAGLRAAVHGESQRHID